MGFTREVRSEAYKESLRLRPKSLDDALNPDFFDPIPDMLEETYTVLIGDKKEPNCKKYVWTTTHPITTGRLSAANVMKSRPGPTQIARNADDKLSAWSLMINETMISNLVLHTNERIELKLEKLPSKTLDSDKYSHLKKTDSTEMKAFIGLWILRGVLHRNLDDAPTLWSDEKGHPVFPATMSLNRFKFLNGCLSFDDLGTRNERWQHDRAAAIRGFFEDFNINCAKMRVPTEYLAIDETLYPYRGNIGFRQYNPAKPAKYGLLYRSLSDSVKRYTYFSLFYAGKPRGIPDSFYVSSVDGYTKYLVDGLSKFLDLSGRNISLDRFFTSLPIAEYCLDKKITIVGTIKSNRKGLPKEVTGIANREAPSTKILYQKNGKMMLTLQKVSPKERKTSFF